jgi:3-keto-disaccharide hydrolase
VQIEIMKRRIPHAGGIEIGIAFERDESTCPYPRAEEQPSYHRIDQGVPPRVNAAKPAREWQSLEIEFIAPRFDATGKKTSNAKFARVVLNRKLIHENVEVSAPTGAAWRLVSEVPRGPLLLQGDHGPVAFRNIQVRPHN